MTTSVLQSSSIHIWLDLERSTALHSTALCLQMAFSSKLILFHFLQALTTTADSSFSSPTALSMASLLAAGRPSSSSQRRKGEMKALKCQQLMNKPERKKFRTN